MTELLGTSAPPRSNTFPLNFKLQVVFLQMVFAENSCGFRQNDKDSNTTYTFVTFMQYTISVEHLQKPQESTIHFFLFFIVRHFVCSNFFSPTNHSLPFFADMVTLSDTPCLTVN